MHHSSNYYIKYYCVHAIKFNVLLLLRFSSSAIVLYVCLFLSVFYYGGAEIKDTDTDTEELSCLESHHVLILISPRM